MQHYKSHRCRSRDSLSFCLLWMWMIHREPPHFHPHSRELSDSLWNIIWISNIDSWKDRILIKLDHKHCTMKYFKPLLCFLLCSNNFNTFGRIMKTSLIPLEIIYIYISVRNGHNLAICLHYYYYICSPQGLSLCNHDVCGQKIVRSCHWRGCPRNFEHS